MNKIQAKAKLAALEQKVLELRAIIDKPEVKPLFPKSWEEGARFVEHTDGCIEELIEGDNFPNWVIDLSRQGRTFYAREEAEAFAKRERARAYCLERINEVNEGDNGFQIDKENYCLAMTMKDLKLNYFDTFIQQSLENGMYIRTVEAVRQLINDPEFVENWKIYKGVE